VFIRQASIEDAPLVLEILNSEILAVDQAHGAFGLDIAKQIIDSPGEPSPTWLFSETEESVVFGLGNLHPDSSAKELELTLSVRAGDSRYPVLLDWLMTDAIQKYPDFTYQIEINEKHEENLKHLASRDFKVIRFYNSLRAKVLPNLEHPTPPEGVTIRTVDLGNMEDLKQWHMVYQQSFADNFGFTPKDFDTWLKVIQADEFIPGDGVFLLHVDSEPAGFIRTDDMDAFDSRGFVAHLGVLKEHRDKGLGKLLLATALAHFSKRGYVHAELGVDTQNASNALRVYEKMGFTRVSSWIAHERPVVLNA
jgi:GNAT superfamily N-acetyltransferase